LPEGALRLGFVCGGACAVFGRIHRHAVAF
jgi:hypothetical protein